MSDINNLVQEYLFEENDEKWIQKADVDEGKMHKLLNVPAGKSISDKFSSGKSLADALINTTGDEGKASSMINFAANTSKDKIFKDAQSYIKNKNNEK